jgi:hypothetical protein
VIVIIYLSNDLSKYGEIRTEGNKEIIYIIKTISILRIFFLIALEAPINIDTDNKKVAK